MHLAVGKHLVHPSEGLAGLGKHHQTAHGAVEAVDNAQKHVAGLVVLGFQVVLNHLRQRTVAGFVALHYLSTLLVHHYKVVVFVNRLHDNVAVL